MRLSPKWCENAFQFVQRGTRQADHLATSVDHLHRCNPVDIDNDHGPVIALVTRSRTACEARIGSLHDYDGIGSDTLLNGAPQFHKRARSYSSSSFAVSIPVTPRITSDRVALDMDVA